MGRHDYLDDKAANYRLMQNIREFWRKRGYNVRVWLERAKDPQGGGNIFVIRTNVVQHVENAKSGYTVE